MEEGEIDVGGRELQPPAVPAERGQGGARGWPGAPPELDEARVEKVGAPVRRPPTVVAGRVRVLERVEILAELRDGIVHGVHPARPTRPQTASGPISPVRMRTT